MSPSRTEETPPSSPHSEESKSIRSNPNSEDNQADETEDEDSEYNLDGVPAAMREEEERMAAESRKEQEKRSAQFTKERKEDAKGGEALDAKFKALDYLLSQSKLYSSIMLSQLQNREQADQLRDQKQRSREENREARAEKVAQDSQRRTTRRAVGNSNDENHQQAKSLPVRGRDRPTKQQRQDHSGRITDYLKDKGLENNSDTSTVQDALKEEVAAAEENDVQADDVGIQNLKSARQPDIVSGGIMRKYQLEGLEWLTSLYENGLNGILADEMGLGKTVQTISFLAFLREKGINGPFLIAAPLSTITNWVDEFERWTPSIPVLLYHGSKAEREEKRKTQLKNPGSDKFPVICTSYEICMNDRKFLAGYDWKFIIIDEGHRLKNLNCRLVQELQAYKSANRLLITGTPLQNNLAELWSLLHFLMPEIFDKLESFESWFDFSALKEKGGHEQIFSEEKKKSLITSLHAILKPFLLRRIKADVEHSLPKKREYVLYAPLSLEQRELYQQILDGNSRPYLEDKVYETLSRNVSGHNTPRSRNSKKTGASSLKRKAVDSGISTPVKSTKTSRASTPATNDSSATRSTRSKKRQDYSEVSDRAYFKSLENQDTSPNASNDEDSVVDEHEQTLKLAKRQIAQKKLQNPVMQLRLCCNSPHNFYEPFLGEAEQDVEINPTETEFPKKFKIDYSPLLTASGKMVLLDRLLNALLASKKGEEPHKVLLFSQFKTQLDILSLYLTYHMKLPHCRIDGSIPSSERGDAIRLFNQSPKHRVFLLSTRAGGQGINLAAADTVILFDSDWNPQQDLQAQDRAHRIGQRRNVIVYRLATRGTVEEMLLTKAEGKRRLEKLVIRKGGVKGSDSKPSKRDRQRGLEASQREEAEAKEEELEGDDEDGLETLRALLAKNDGQVIDLAGEDASANSLSLDGKKLLTDHDLDLLTDRSDAAYTGLESGAAATEGDAFKLVETKKDKGILEGL